MTINLDPALACQQAVYAALTGAGLTVYDLVPQNPAFPFVQIGDDQIIFGEDNAYENSASCDVHCVVHAFSRYKGKTELKTIGQTLRATLETYLSISGFETIDYEFISYLAKLDPDGLTQHLIYEVKYTVVAISN